MPVGVHGEILIAGDPVASGYLNALELTNERFIASPWVDGDTVYCTGDVGRYLADGNIEFIGRSDDQVKIRGFRVELGEVETCLAQYDGVFECSVIVREDTPDDKRLVAYYVPSDLEVPPQVHDLRAFVRKKLPDYMVPTAFVLLEKLPLSPNLKVNRKSLPRPEGDLNRPTDQIILPQTEMEKGMAVIWTKILKLERVSIDDNFFELGGHSLLASQMVARMKKELHLDVSISKLFDYPTIRELAQEVSISRDVPVSQDSIEVGDIPDIQEFPLSFAQQQMWFLDKLEGGSREYILGDSLRLRGVLDVYALKRALQEIVSRHQALRTTFFEVDGVPMQRVFKDFSITLPIEDISHLDSQKREELIQATVNQEYGRSFNLLEGPLLRMKLLILSDEEHALFIFFHHIITDGWSMQVFHRELSYLYESFKEGVEPSLAPMRFRYSDFVRRVF